jgi:hypothetical protein
MAGYAMRDEQTPNPMRGIPEQGKRVGRLYKFIAVVALHVNRGSAQIAVLDKLSHTARDVDELIVVTGCDFEAS